MSQKILLYRIKADSPEFACEKVKELVIPKVDLGLSNEEEIVVAQVLTILNEFVKERMEKGERLSYFDVLEDENLKIIKKNLEKLKGKWHKKIVDGNDTDFIKQIFLKDFSREIDFSQIRYNESFIVNQFPLEEVIHYLEKAIPNLEDIFLRYLGLQNLSKKTIRDIPRTNLFKDYHVSIFDCLFQIFDHESSLGDAFEIADELKELNCLESANEVRETAYNIENNNFWPWFDAEILGCLSEDNESYLCGDDDYPSSFTFEKLNKRYDNDPKYRERWNPESKSYEDKIENFNVLIDLDDDEDVDHDGHFHPLEELNYEGEKGKIYIVFVDAGGSEY